MIFQKVKNKELYKVHYPDLPTLLDAINSADPENMPGRNAGQYKGMITPENANSRWYNYYDLSRVTRELETPPECGAAVKQLADDLEEQHQFTEKKRKVRHRLPDGDDLDPVAWAQRDPEGWSATVKEQQAKGVIRIAVNIVVSAGKDPEDLFYRGAAAAALADVLEGAGYSTEIVGFISVQGFYSKKRKSHNAVLSVTLKEPDQMLDVNSVALATAEIGFFRVIGLAALTVSTEKEIAAGMGRPGDLPDGMKENFDIILDADVFNYKDAKQTIEKYAESFNA